MIGLLLATVTVSYSLQVGSTYSFCMQKVGQSAISCFPLTASGQVFTVADDTQFDFWVKDGAGNESEKTRHSTPKKKLATPILVVEP